MKEARVVVLKNSEKTNQEYINRVLVEQYSEGWQLIRNQYIPGYQEVYLRTYVDTAGSLLLFFEREIAVSPEQITIAVEEFRESLASLLD